MCVCVYAWSIVDDTTANGGQMLRPCWMHNPLPPIATTAATTNSITTIASDTAITSTTATTNTTTTTTTTTITTTTNFALI